MSKQDARSQRGLVEQLGFLEWSCKGYDQGRVTEAVRIASALRVLFKDGPHPKTISILTQLGMRGCELLSTKAGSYPMGDHTAFVSFSIKLGSTPPIQARPRLGERFMKLYRSDWWEKEPVFTHGAKSYTRKDLVLATAEREGGAHFDTASEQFYEELVEGIGGFSLDASKLSFEGKPPYDPSIEQHTNGLQFAMLRQFGYEVLVSATNFKWVT